MKKNIYDLAVDMLKERRNKALEVMHQEFKGTQPYRQEKVSEKQMIKDYMEFTPEKEQFLLQSGVSPDVIQSHHMRMQDLMRRQHA